MIISKEDIIILLSHFKVGIKLKFENKSLKGER